MELSLTARSATEVWARAGIATSIDAAANVEMRWMGRGFGLDMGRKGIARRAEAEEQANNPAAARRERMTAGRRSGDIVVIIPTGA
jgi:hypothetical protein